MTSIDTRRQRPAVKPTRAFLREVAEVYRAAEKTKAIPDLHVAEHFDVPRTTAMRWIDLARRTGELGAAK